MHGKSKVFVEISYFFIVNVKFFIKKGMMKTKSKIEVYENLGEWNLVQGENSSLFYENLEENCWSFVEIEVKPLHTFKQSNYQKYSFQGNTFNFLDEFINYHR